MVRNKKGFLRIVEASVSIVAVLTVLFLLFTQTRAPESPDYASDIAIMLEELAQNPNLRSSVLAFDVLADPAITPIPVDVEAFIVARRPQNLEHETRICEIDDVCGQLMFVDSEIYSAERIISANLTFSDPRKVKVFMWRAG